MIAMRYPIIASLMHTFDYDCGTSKIEEKLNFKIQNDTPTNCAKSS